MTIEEKIKYIENFSGLVFDGSAYVHDGSDGAVARKLQNIDVFSKNDFDKIYPLTRKTNFRAYYINKTPLNANSILFVNLTYNLIRKYETQKDHIR